MVNTTHFITWMTIIMKISRKVMYINRTFTSMFRAGSKNWDPCATCDFECRLVIHVRGRCSSLGFSHWAKYHRCDVRHIIWTESIHLFNIQEKQVFWLNFVRCFSFIFQYLCIGLPYTLPLILLLMQNPNKEWKLESKGNRPKWPKSGNKDIENHWRYHMIVLGRILITADGIIMDKRRC